MAQAASAPGGKLRSLSEGDRNCEQCFAQDGMVQDLTSIGVQLVHSECPAGHSQIMNYLRSAKKILGIEFDCELDSKVTAKPIRSHVQAEDSLACGPNPKLGTNDPLSCCQSNLEVIRIGAAWQAARSSKQKLKDVVLAVIDSGVDPTHPDLVDQFWKNRHGEGCLSLRCFASRGG
ncbi:hypothetical protein FOZ63_003083, partial [Perkinsus olseni]